MALTDNLISYYKLDESSGNADDSVGVNDLTNTDITYSACKINNGAVFNGTSAKLVQANTAGLGTSGSIAFWVYTASTNNRDFVNAPSSTGINIQLFSSKIYCRVITDTAFLNDPTNMPQSQWNFIVFTWATNTSRILYLNGSSVASRTTNLNNLIDGALTFGTNGSTYFAGNEDEIGLWTRVLSATEVTALYNSGNGLTYPFSTSAIKTINGLAKASVKTVNGLAIASVKTFNGLT